MHDNPVKVPKSDKDLPEAEEQRDEVQAKDLLVEPSAEKQKMPNCWKNMKLSDRCDNMKVSFNCSFPYFSD